MQDSLESIYHKLYARFGPQQWWPATTSFEVMVGAILTQNTNWGNVQKAIENLKKNRLLTPRKLFSLTDKKLASLIRPAGYFNVKTKRLKHFLHFLLCRYKGNMTRMSGIATNRLRAQLLEVNGIGPETADSILLYGLAKRIFVVDGYTKRILSRHGLIQEHANYEEVQRLFMSRLKADARLFNEYHALLVRLGKEFCLKNKPKCSLCPLKN